MSVTQLTETTFHEEIGASDVPVVVDFWAEWCGPCKVLAPVLDEIAAEHAGKLRIVKVNVDENPSLARQYDIMSIPTIMVFKDGQPDLKMIGARGKPQLLEELADYL